MTTLVATDLDGSLWDSQLDCHPRTVAALHELAARQVLVLTATGRRANSALPGLDKLPMRYPSVLLNGAHGIDFTSAGWPVFHAVCFSNELGGALIEAFDSFGVTPVIYLSDGTVLGRAEPTTHLRHLENVQADWRVTEPAVAVQSGEVLAMKMIGLPHDVLAEAASAARNLGSDLAFAPDHLFGGWTLSMRPKGISKRDGIQAWIDHAQLEVDRVIAIGDGDNDVEMLEFADLALAVEGGHQAAANTADHMIGPPTIGGWAEVINFL